MGRRAVLGHLAGQGAEHGELHPGLRAGLHRLGHPSRGPLRRLGDHVVAATAEPLELKSSIGVGEHGPACVSCLPLGLRGRLLTAAHLDANLGASLRPVRHAGASPHLLTGHAGQGPHERVGHGLPVRAHHAAANHPVVGVHHEVEGLGLSVGHGHPLGRPRGVPLLAVPAHGDPGALLHADTVLPGV